MSKRRETKDSRCPKCKVNFALCFCDRLSYYSNKTKIEIIIHTKEFFLPSNTANLLVNTLDNIQLHLRGNRDNQTSTEINLQPDINYIYLYPDESAVELDQNFILSLNTDWPIVLIVPDGTWAQARKIKKRTPGIDKIPSVKLTSSGPSIYTLRKQIYNNGLSTAEAVAHALAIIENEECSKHILNSLKLMNDQFEKGRSLDSSSQVG